MLFALAIILFVLLVVVHEFGHYIVAKRNGVEVEEFGVGFPPRLLSFKRKNDKTLYSINLLPLGGFVQLKGESDTDKRKGSFGAASLKVKAKIMLAGVAMNLATAYVLFLGLSLVGMPQVVPDQYSVASDAKIVRDYSNKGKVTVGTVAKDSPAERAGVKAGDEIVAINGEAIDAPDRLVALTKDNAGKEVTLAIIQDGTPVTKQVMLNPENKNQSGYLGLSAESAETGVQLVRSTWSAPIVAAGLMKQLTVLNLQGIGSLIGDVSNANFKSAGDKVTGPVGIVRLLKSNSVMGVGVVLWLIAFISLVLAVMNLLPIPALDGGKLYTTLIYRLLGKELTPKAERIIYGTSFAFLLLLFVVITYVDVRR